jgi:predicted metal-binding membrane protein
LQERVIRVAALGAITALSWLYLVWMPMLPSDVGIVGRLLAVLPTRVAGALLTFMMWAVMMVAMMLPSASPMVLTYGSIVRGRADTAAYAVWLFAAGYVAIWTAFSAATTAGQLFLEQTSLLRGAAQATPLIGALLLVVAGIYQLTPLKSTCLAHCRSPLGFFMTEWRSGASGAFTMGIKHGAYCVGCCWMLMGLLFVFGVMNLLWVAALSGLVLWEKLAPFGRGISRASGILMLAGAIALVMHR